jgi:predicted acylesterase/phospholipase RssA
MHYQYDACIIWDSADEAWAKKLVEDLNRLDPGLLLTTYAAERGATNPRPRVDLKAFRHLVVIWSDAAAGPPRLDSHIQDFPKAEAAAGGRKFICLLLQGDKAAAGFTHVLEEERQALDYPAGLQGLTDSRADARAREVRRLYGLIQFEAPPEQQTGAAAPAGEAASPPAAEDVERLVGETREILNGKFCSVEDKLKLATRLLDASQFRFARRLLKRARGEADFGRLDADKQLKAIHELAVCTYKDPDLPAADRLQRALDTLETGARLTLSEDPETLGLAGSIHKRIWEVGAQKHHLEKSLACYLRGYEFACRKTPPGDFGYPGVNAAFVLDLLAEQETGNYFPGSPEAAGPAAQHGQSRTIREDLRARLLADYAGNPGKARNWWFYATLAETCFGLFRYGEARYWIGRGKKACPVADWQLEATSRQVAALARLAAHGGGRVDNKAATEMLKGLIGGNEESLRRTLVGKFGLALSGGGFRASLFHIGVLARLAELDVLRSVEVLSCVSGGSIIGAHYYLEVRHLLESKGDNEITRDDYVKIVRRIAADFLAGVQTDIRTSAMADVGTNLRMTFQPDYSRTERLAELYEERLFSRVEDGEGKRPRYLNELFVKPKGESSFDIKRHNWRRLAKVPVLVLNATTLNTGHNWQFTASFMGEPPSRIDTRVDGNERLRRMYYKDAPPEYQKMRLGRAVAASACVPGIFEPLVFKGLYPDRVVRLVDGGVHDNQGVDALLDQDCTVLLVSDASGQMQTLKKPPAELLGVPFRANAILQARVRETQFQELVSRRRSLLLRGLMFIHLRKDLGVDPVDWENCPDPTGADDDESQPDGRRKILTPYGMRKDVQKHLSAIRTDLDAFSDLEAFALMTSGYQMTAHEFDNPNSIAGFPAPVEAVPRWDFLCVEGETSSTKVDAARFERLVSVLETASRNAFKTWQIPGRVSFWVSALVGLIVLSIVFGFLLGVARLGWVAATACTLAIPAAGAAAASAVRGGFVFRFGLYALGILPARVHIWIERRTYLEKGQVERGSPGSETETHAPPPGAS